MKNKKEIMAGYRMTQTSLGVEVKVLEKSWKKGLFQTQSRHFSLQSKCHNLTTML